MESDPLGLFGGPSTYAYVEANPLLNVDVFGLQAGPPPEPPGPSDVISIDSAIKRGDIARLESMMEGLNPAGQQLARNAITRLQSKAGDLIARECKGSINREFPSQLRDKTLKEIIDLKNGGDDAARKAYKLLNSNRFKK